MGRGRNNFCSCEGNWGLSGWPWLTLCVLEESWTVQTIVSLGVRPKHDDSFFCQSVSSLAFLADQRAAGAQFWLLSTMAHVGTLQFCMRYRLLPTQQQRTASGSVVFAELCCSPHPPKGRRFWGETLCCFFPPPVLISWIPGCQVRAVVSQTEEVLFPTIM